MNYPSPAWRKVDTVAEAISRVSPIIRFGSASAIIIMRLRMADPHPPTRTEVALDDLERQNEEAFNRLKQLVHKLKDLLGQRRDQSEASCVTSPSRN